jgi:hypothetical protein
MINPPIGPGPAGLLTAAGTHAASRALKAGQGLTCADLSVIDPAMRPRRERRNQDAAGGILNRRAAPTKSALQAGDARTTAQYAPAAAGHFRLIIPVFGG